MTDKDYLDLIHQAQEYGSQEKWDQCIKYYERAFKIYIKVDDLLDCGLAYLENNCSFRALQTIETVIKANSTYYKGYYYKGIYYERIDETEKALFEYQKALENTIESIEEKAEILFKIGKIKDDQDKADEAIEYYKKSLAIDSNHFYSNLNLGSIFERRNELEQALTYTINASNANDKMKMASYNLGVIYGKMEKIEEAKKCYLNEITKEDFYPYAYYNLAILCKDFDNNLIQAKLYYLKALEYLKTDCNVWYNLGCCHVLLKDFVNATDCFYGAILINCKIYDFLLVDDEIAQYLQTQEFERLKEKLNKK